MGFDQDRVARQLEGKLRALRGKAGMPQGLVDFLGAVAAAQLRAQSRATAAVQAAGLPVPEDELATPEQRAQGLPLLARQRFRYDAGQVSALGAELLGLARAVPGPLAEAAEILGRVLAPGGSLDLEQLLAAHLAQDDDVFAGCAELTPQVPRLAAFLAQACLAPFAAAQAELLAAQVPGGLMGLDRRAWPYGHCPVCGSLPYISVLREKEGQRMLCCSFCQTEYRAPRLACPYCGEDDPARLSIQDSPQEPGFRLDVCGSCGNYLKTVDFRSFDRVSIPALDDLESLALDCLASDQGLTRPTPSAFGF